MSDETSAPLVATALANSIHQQDIAQRLAEELRAGLGGKRVDLCLIFASAHFEDELEAITFELQELLAPRVFIGGTGETVICGDREYEGRAALSVWAAHLPGAKLEAFHLSREDLSRLDSIDALRDQLGAAPEDAPSFVLLADPFSFPAPDFLNLLFRAYPERPAIGGLASAGEKAGQNILIFDGQALRNGLVGVSLWGNLQFDTIVSQGCRPIGRHMVVTQAERNVILQVGGKPPLTVVNELIQQIAPRDVELMRQRGLMIGCVINEYQGSFRTGDFLIRNPIGFDSNTGAMHVNDLVRTGQTIQFHVRDSSSAAQDLESLLEPQSDRAVAGALLFTCNGRGTRLFQHPNHDARTVVDACGSPPLAGMFCAGEIGPVGNRNYVHGHTASIALLRARGEPADA